MSIQVGEDGTILLRGVCPVDDAEMLLHHLWDRPHAGVDWRDCEQAHTAVIQVLMFAGAAPMGPPRGAFLRQVVEPALRRALGERDMAKGRTVGSKIAPAAFAPVRGNV